MVTRSNSVELTQKYINELSYKIIGCAIEVHKEMGPGLLESLYEECLIIELRNKGLFVNNQEKIIPYYKNIQLSTRLRYDILVEDLILVENKSVQTLNPIDTAQLLSYMEVMKKPKGLLINYSVVNIVNEGLVPLVNDYFRKLPKE